MKELYVDVEMEIFEFTANDVIATSTDKPPIPDDNSMAPDQDRGDLL